MYKALMVVSSLLCFVACGSDVYVGGPYDAGAGSGGQATSDPREAARAYAKKTTPCQTDADCCLVVDECLAQGLIMGLADKDEVRSLLDSADTSSCVGCIPPFLQLSCEQHVCVGTLVSPQDTSPDSISWQLMRDHCGFVQTQDSMSGQKGTVLGCGG